MNTCMEPVKFSILDLGYIIEGNTIADTFREMAEFARAAESAGFHRYWLTEHHNTPGVCSSATSLLIGHVAAATRTIRVGSGGIMLPNHPPLMVAEQFGTLATLYPGRIDLGLGRAPGSDELTARALRRDPSGADRFPQEILELQALLEPARANQAVVAIPGAGTQVPLWILGSSLFGAQVAAMLGLPYVFASHIAPDVMTEALRVYRAKFRPSAQLSRPYVMVGASVLIADTEAEAQHLFTSSQQNLTNHLRGVQGDMPPPIDDIDSFWTPEEKAYAATRLRYAAVGAPQAVRKSLESLIAETQADEIMAITVAHDPAARRRSLELLGELAPTLARAEQVAAA